MALVSIQEITEAQINAKIVEQDLKAMREAIGGSEHADSHFEATLSKETDSMLLKIEIVNKFFSKIVTKTLLKIGE